MYKTNLISFRFGFVSFDCKEAVAKVLKQGTIYLKGRKITIAPAVKKHVSTFFHYRTIIL